MKKKKKIDKKKWEQIEEAIDETFRYLSLLFVIFLVGVIFGMACLFMARLNITVLQGIIAYGTMFYTFSLIMYPWVNVLTLKKKSTNSK